MKKLILTIIIILFSLNSFSFAEDFTSSNTSEESDATELFIGEIIEKNENTLTVLPLFDLKHVYDEDSIVVIDISHIDNDLDYPKGHIISLDYKEQLCEDNTFILTAISVNEVTEEHEVDTPSETDNFIQKLLTILQYIFNFY